MAKQASKIPSWRVFALIGMTGIALLLWIAVEGVFVVAATRGLSWAVPIGFFILTIALVVMFITVVFWKPWLRSKKPVNARPPDTAMYRGVVPKARSFQWDGLKGNTGFLAVWLIVLGLFALIYWIFWQIAGVVRMEGWILAWLQFSGCAGAVFPLFKIMDALVAKSPYKQIPDALWFVKRLGKLYGIGFLAALPVMLLLGLLGGPLLQFPALIATLLVGSTWLAWRNRRTS